MNIYEAVKAGNDKGYIRRPTWDKSYHMIADPDNGLVSLVSRCLYAESLLTWEDIAADDWEVVTTERLKCIENAQSDPGDYDDIPF